MEGIKILIIGDRLNTTIKKVGEAVKKRDKEFVQNLVKDQIYMGADILDVHTRENIEEMEWLLPIIQEETDKQICIDTDDPEFLKIALSQVKGKAMVNSITGEKNRIKAFLPLIIENDADVIALALDEKGIPKTPEEVLAICEDILHECIVHGVQRSRVYFDPLVLPVSTDSKNGVKTIESLKLLKEKLDVQTTVGLTNISEGLPNRTRIDQAFLLMALPWMDSALMDPTDEGLVSASIAGNLVMGKDKFARKYTKAHRKGLLK